MATLEDVLKDFDQRLRSIEERLDRLDGSPPPVKPAPLPQPTRPPSPIPPPPAAAKESKAETTSLFGIIGIIFVILASVFFVKLTIDSGWLTPTRQILLASLFGASCLLLPHFVEKLRDAYGSLLSGAGVVVLHLTWFAAYQVHQLLEADVALVVASLVGIVSVLLNSRLAQKSFVLVAIAGTYLAAPIVGFTAVQFSTIAGFLLVWNISFSALGLALFRRDLLILAAYFAALMVGIISVDMVRTNPEMAQLFLIHQGMQFAVFALAMTAFSLLHREEMSSEEAWWLCPLLLLVYANIQYLVRTISPEAAPWLGLAFGGVVLLLYSVASRQFGRELASAPSLFTFASLVLFHSLYLELTPDNWKPLVSLGIAGTLALISDRVKGSAWAWPCFVALGVVAYGAALSIGGDLGERELTTYGFLYGFLALAFALFKEKNFSARGSTFPLLLGFAHIEVMLALYRLSRLVSFGGALFVSVTWGLYALAVLGFSMQKKDRTLGNSAILILIAVCLKGTFYDLWNTSSLVRVLSLLFAGLVLYACGWIFQRMQTWEK